MLKSKSGLWTLAGIVLVLIVLAILIITNRVPKNTEFVTYEFETFDGVIVKIDETNIISQKTENNVLETTEVPADAEVIAPGRDYVYLDDGEFYYVEDAANDLLTKALK